MSEASDRWFLRARGRILGPFTPAQLEAMRGRGQVSQFHELSQDRRLWVTASGVEWLFPPVAQDLASRDEIAPAVNSPATDAAQAWFYGDDGTSRGPVSTDQIVTMVHEGRIRGDTPVWREGLPAWLALRDAPEIGFLVNTTAGPSIASELPATSETGPGGQGDTDVSRRARPPGPRLGLGTSLLVLVLVGGTALLLAVQYRRGGSWFSLAGSSSTAGSHARCVDSQLSSDIPRALGLVVSGATVTDLTTGEMFEVPGSRGTCFAIDARGHLLTNRHVVEEFVRLSRADAKIADLEKTNSRRVRPKLWVYFSKERYEATVVYSSGSYDLAVLKVARVGPCFCPSATPRIIQGTHIYALGFPAASSQELSVEGAILKSMRKVSEHVESVLDESDFRYSITDGIISLVRRENDVEYIQHGAQISGGSSGGPLIGEDGRVIGINTLITFDEKKPGVGLRYYAISISQALAELRRRVPGLFAD